MRIHYSYSTIMALLATFTQFSSEFRMDISENDEAKFCANRDHYILKPKATCCNRTVIQPGINIEEHFEACGKSGEANEATLSATWRIYGCIVKAAAGGEGDQVTLEKFAELMTKNYDDIKKTQIMERAKAASVSSSAAFTDVKGLNGIRVAYFDIEHQVCSGLVSSAVQKERECKYWEEENHRGGSCCGNMSSFPFDIQMGSRYLNLQFPLRVGKCRSKLQRFFEYYLNATDSITNNVALLCDFSCFLAENGVVDYSNFNIDDTVIENLVKVIYPRWISTSAKNKAVEFVSSQVNVTATRQRIEGYEFPGSSKTNGTYHEEHGAMMYVQNISVIDKGPRNNTDAEFMRRTFPIKTALFATVCAVHKEVLYLSRMALDMDCGKE